MLFSSLTFLFVFLPLVWLGHTLAPRNTRNLWLLAASLLFYAWGEGRFVVLMLASSLINWVFGLAIESRRNRRGHRTVVALGVVVNLAFLACYKYANFAVDALNQAAGYWTDGAPIVTLPAVHLPIGISFFTFQAISYLLDVARGQQPGARNPIQVALYIALFPQLIAGPIVRYADVAAEIKNRVLRLPDVSYGVARFVMGLGKKVLIANTVAAYADQVFNAAPNTLTASTAWLGLLAYTLQIYFDFSGYSDMAIGLGRIFGFHFLENFNHPYAASSVTAFWRRWHMSLSSWFRDYLYIPLGGNRAGTVRTYINLLMVFLLCGLWHGASWNFVVWGLCHGAFLVFERLAARHLKNVPNWLRPFGHIYTLLAVMFAWVFFRADNLHHAVQYTQTLLVGQTGQTDIATDTRLLFVMVLGGLLSVPLWPMVHETLRNQRLWPALCYGAPLALVLVFWLCVANLANGGYNPFIYFRF